MQCKKAQVAETTTWVVATVIIIFILVVSVYASSGLSKAVKSVNSRDSAAFLKEKNADLLLKQSLFGFLKTKNPEGKIIYLDILEKNQITDEEKNLAKIVFTNINSNGNAIAISINEIQSLLTEKKLSTLGSKRSETIKTSANSEIKIIVQN